MPDDYNKRKNDDSELFVCSMHTCSDVLKPLLVTEFATHLVRLLSTFDIKYVKDINMLFVLS